MKKVIQIYKTREKKLAQELEREARKSRKIDEARKATQQDGRSACEPIEEMLDEY